MDDYFMLTQAELDSMFEAIREREMAAELALNAILKDQIEAILPKNSCDDGASLPNKSDI